MRMSMFQKRFVPVALACAALLVLGGCASKKFVQDGLDAQEAKLNDMATQVEANQRRISETSQKVDVVQGEAKEASRVGREANTAAGEAKGRADDAYILAKGKLLYTVTLTDTAGDFAIDCFELSDSAKTKLDSMASRLKSENKNVFLEIAGHTDSTGSEAHNLELGYRRAESVRRYMSMTHGIPLHRMSVMSYGESSPAADNGTREGRAQNRRVEIRVLS